MTGFHSMGLDESLGHGQKILLVSKDEELCARLREHLHKRGFHCASYAKVDDVLRGVEPALVAAAVVDIELDRVDGIELGRLLKERAGASLFFPVVVLASKVGADELRRGYRDGGCDGFIGMPVDELELSLRLQSLILRREQQAELVRVNAALERTHERRRDLATMLVHDLRNPLAGIIGNLQLMGEFEDDATMRKQCVRDLVDLSERAASLVNGLLEVEEMEEGLLQAHREEVEVHGFFSRFPRFYETVFVGRGLALELDVVTDVVARFDRQLIARILENLLDNSVRYAPRGGRVLLRVRTRGSDLVIEVGNSGPAIPEQERVQMFDRYYRLEGRRPGARANRGLGLYFCRLAAHCHEGSIEVESRQDYPACFVLSLPSCVANASQAATPHTEV